MESPGPEVNEQRLEPEVDEQRREPEVGNATPSSPTPSVPDSNGDACPAPPPPPRLASITDLILGQKSSHPWDSTSPPEEDFASAAAAAPRSPSTADSGPTPPSLARSARLNDDDDAGPPPRQTGSFGTAVSSTLGAHRRTALAAGVPSAAAAGAVGSAAAGLTETDLRRFVFHHPRAKRMVSGLRVHALTRQAFVSSFTVGLAIGSVVAIVLKILKDVASRMLYS